jgi:hypothetical protein
MFSFLDWGFAGLLLNRKLSFPASRMWHRCVSFASHIFEHAKRNSVSAWPTLAGAEQVEYRRALARRERRVFEDTSTH